MLLYTSHFLTSWTSRIYEFASYLFIVKIFEKSLLLPSVYGFLTTLSGVLFSTYVGGLVDKTTRFKFVSMTLFLQKISIILSCILFYLLFLIKPSSSLSSSLSSSSLSSDLEYYLNRGGYVLIIFLGCLLKLSSIGNTIAVEKDWVLVISRGNTETMVTIMKRIDLFCKMMAPISVGFLTLTSPMAPLMIAFWNVISYLIEYQLLYKVYLTYPELDDARDTTPLLSDQLLQEEVIGDTIMDNHNNNNNTSNYTNLSNHQQQQEERSFTWKDYIHHRAFLPSLSISLLYLTVLSFGGIMVSYLKLIGYDDITLGILRAVAGICGIASTALFPLLHHKIGIIRTGHWALWFEVITLLPVIVSFKLIPPSSSTSWVYSYLSPILLFGGMSLSRIGLWMYDISETVLLQQIVEPDLLGIVFGYQHTLCNFFDLTQYVLTMIISDPKLFFIPAIISFLSVFLAALTYTFFVKKERGHIFHLHKD
ncbi:unnamed protein product [Cunninghamella blakesleeana]